MLFLLSLALFPFFGLFLFLLHSDSSLLFFFWTLTLTKAPQLLDAWDEDMVGWATID